MSGLEMSIKLSQVELRCRSSLPPTRPVPGVMPEPVRNTHPAGGPAASSAPAAQPASDSAHPAAPHSVPAAAPAPASIAGSGPVSQSAAELSGAPSPVPMAASQLSVGPEPVSRRAPEPAADEWARYAAAGHHSAPPDPDQARLAAAAAAAAAAAQVGVYGASGSPQHGVSAPVNGGDPTEDGDIGNRNSMGFQITSITQSSAEPDADPIDESGDEDVSDMAESARLSATSTGTSAVDGLPGRLQLPLAGTPPPSAGLTPRELTASPGVTSAEVLPVIPTIDGFGITLVPGALESVDAHGTAEIVEFPSEIEMDLMPTGLTVGVAPGSPGDDLQETWQSRFKVVKIETNVPFKRGRWQCMDYMDQPEAAGADGTASAGSSAHSSVHLTGAGELEPPPQPAASEEASLPGLADEPGLRREPRIDAATPDPASAAGGGAGAAQPSLSVPPPAPPAGLVHGRDAAAAASAPNVHAMAAERGAPMTLGVAAAAPAAGLARQTSQPATPEEARLAADGVPVFRPADGEPRSPTGGGLTLPDLLPNASLLELVQSSVTDEQEGAADSSFSGLARALSTGHFAVLGSSPPADGGVLTPEPASLSRADGRSLSPMWSAMSSQLCVGSAGGPLPPPPLTGVIDGQFLAAIGLFIRHYVSTSPGSSGAVEKTEPIDNKIEQAMVSG
ncbi:Protein bunched, class 2/F/G isoform [Amphibalanus amphitrite]|uniref:Protein bunched, class 2/F/G isoform n=1 Tax=Amphibalanus amphitrite TaxID=1232801 RepID=A0A6A4WMJ1_AMPAM|nr:Protein bunched, class 2/F/G isoform [Amphibalanus amphitrite]